MANIAIKEDQIYVYKSNNVEKISNYFLILGNEIVNIKDSVVMKNSFSSKVFNINELLYSNKIDLLDKVFEQIKYSIDEKIIRVEIHSSVVINNELQEYMNKRNISFVREKELIKGFNNYVEKHSNNESKYIYKLMKQEIVSYIFNKYNKELLDLDICEQYRIKNILSCLCFEIIYKIKKYGDFFVDLSILHKEGAISKLKINLSKMDLENINLINNMNLNKKIPKQYLYDMKEEYKVAMISPFSFGKSTILNALIGKAILKTDLRAETAVITKIINNDDTSFLTKWNNGDLKDFSYESEADLSQKLANATSARADGNQLQEVSINYKYSSLPGITLVDSPGLFSRYKHHNDISIKALDISDMIIFVIDPCKIGERNFSQILKENIDGIIKQKKHFCFVLSKLDLYEEDEQRIKDELNTVLNDLGLNFAPIFFVSGYFGIKALMLRDGEIDIDSIRKDRNIFVLENEDILSGKLINEHHWKNLWEFSRIDELIDFILYAKEIKIC